MSPPCSPDPTVDRGFRDLKENKEPSPKVKRRRSVKISSVAFEPAQWQNDALQILTCTNDYRSMNDFLMKKVQTNITSRYFMVYFFLIIFMEFIIIHLFWPSNPTTVGTGAI